MCEETSFNGRGNSPASPRRPTSHVRRVDTFKELTPLVLQSSMALALPIDATPSFENELVRVTWRLCFEFTITPGPVGQLWDRGAKHSILRWEVPVHVIPPAGGGDSVGALEPIASSVMERSLYI
ncbi:unnamed protein product [Discosporangium mesarthrocarpum]